MISTKELNSKEKKPYVVVLGSSKSIKELSTEELNFIALSTARIALNKFGAFYEIAKIQPSHIFFYDDYSRSSLLFLKYIILKIKKLKFKEITFVISQRYQGYLYTNVFFLIINKLISSIKYFFYQTVLKIGRLTIKPINVLLFNKCKRQFDKLNLNDEIIRYNLISKSSSVQYIEIQNWKSRGNTWAKSINEKLYHYRGSFTSVLNYISIIYPHHDIILAGVDFNSFGYFFSDEMLNKLPFDTEDWTTAISKENNKHFSIIDYQGTKIDDELPFVISELESTGNKMYSLSKNSYLVVNGFVDYLVFN